VYTFLTKHSGIGSGHVTPGGGESAPVVYLNDLLVKIVGEYLEIVEDLDRFKDDGTIIGQCQCPSEEPQREVACNDCFECCHHVYYCYDCPTNDAVCPCDCNPEFVEFKSHLFPSYSLGYDGDSGWDFNPIFATSLEEYHTFLENLDAWNNDWWLQELPGMFDEDFFADNYLLMFVHGEGYAATGIQITSVSDSGEIMMTRSEVGGAVADVCGFWLIMIEFADDFAPSGFALKFTDVYHDFCECEYECCEYDGTCFVCSFTDEECCDCVHPYPYLD
jgi:hypothetical protein